MIENELSDEEFIATIKKIRQLRKEAKDLSYLSIAPVLGCLAIIIIDIFRGNLVEPCNIGMVGLMFAFFATLLAISNKAYQKSQAFFLSLLLQMFKEFNELQIEALEKLYPKKEKIDESKGHR